MDETSPQKDKTDLEKKVDEYMICNFGTSADMPEIYSTVLNNVFVILKVYEEGFMLSDKRQREINAITLESHKLLLELMRINTRLKVWELHVSKAVIQKNEASIDKNGIQKDVGEFKRLGADIDGLLTKTSSIVGELEKDYKGL